jgi:hypothetical protein
MHESSPGDTSPGNDSLLAEQRRRNEASRDAWQRFASHRARVTQLLLDAAREREAPRLMLLGAGNCNDVELASLATAYRQIDLVDWDAQALDAGVASQGVAGHPALVRHTGVDLREIGEGLGSWQYGIERSDVVASLCVLSQLIEQAVTQSKLQDPRDALPLVQTIRRQHLLQMTDRLVGGGEAVLITDFVSSDTLPELTAVNEADLPNLVRRALSERNFFTGLHPAVLLDALRNDAALAPTVTDATLQSPWRWDFGPRIYAVFALRWWKLQDAARNL